MEKKEWKYGEKEYGTGPASGLCDPGNKAQQAPAETCKRDSGEIGGGLNHKTARSISGS